MFGMGKVEQLRRLVASGDYHPNAAEIAEAIIKREE
jgi:anti-sigma28 factor (negative regulator of flagellin synthesis)